MLKVICQGHCGYRSHKHSGGREGGRRSTLPPLISDTMLTGLARAAWKLEGEQVCAQGEVVETKR